MGVGGSSWDSGDVVTKDRINQKTTLIDTGTNISAFASPQQGMQAFATDTSAVFVGANWYYYNGAWFPRQGFRGSGTQIAALITNSMAYQGLFVYCTSAGSGYAVDHVYFYDGSTFKDTNDLINPIFKTYSRWHIGPINSIDDVNVATTGTATITDVKGNGGIRFFVNATNDNARWDYGISSLGLGFRRDRKWEIIFLVILEDTPSDFQAEFGVSDQTGAQLSGNNDDFAVFYINSGSGNWHVKTNDNGAVAPAGVNTGVAASVNTPYLLSIINDESSLFFRINGTLVHTASTDLPTATTILSMRGMLETTAATTREMRMPYAEAWIDAT
jgi:hypothetical protein